MSNQISIVSYAPQPYFETGAPTILGYYDVDDIENTEGVFDPDLSNYTTVNSTAGAAEFAFQIDFDKLSDHLENADMSLGLIGCSLLTYEDSSGAPDLETEFSENIVCLMSTDLGTVTDELISYAHNSEDSIYTFGKEPLPSIISGGRSNILFKGLGKSSTGATASVYITIQRKSADALTRPHAKLIMGHLFIGVDVVVTIDPKTFGWSLNSENAKFIARDYGAVHSDGTLVKRSTGEFIKIEHGELIGSEIIAIASEINSETVPNFFDLVKSNTSYPLLFNPYPLGPIDESTLTLEEINLTARQNFFSIYGFMEDPLEIQTDDYRDGLNSLYRARFKIIETR
jgi:hypothetical protein